MPRAHALSRLALALGLGALASMAVPADGAQASQCTDITKILEARKAIIQQLNGLANNKTKTMEPTAACATFGKLMSNGNEALKFMEVNKDWCQIPDAFVENLKGDHQKTSKIRNQACTAAAQKAKMERAAKQQAQQGGQGGQGGLLGGPGLTGQYRMPQGAM